MLPALYGTLRAPLFRSRRQTCSAAATGRQQSCCDIARALLTSGPFTAMKLIPDSVASAFAVSVLLQPGGPYSNTPLGGLTPSRVKVSACVRGHSTHSLSFCFVTVCPPMSDHLTDGVSMKTSRIAEGRMDASEAERSCRVSRGSTSSAGCEASHRLIATDPASRTRDERSAPT